ncbi:pyridoxal phosphate-dependent decarboxylase family protein [Oryzibacter oryziterrae]|uniref:pyridoxal phosphate-dependent decarboxylase family protein n=1 Tax=Oryzibacter oryziterrae TaxID=2766474 RepID=UPI001F01333E|nr:pyridoxal-dependent decarboxylase [Oryzibacter oryziterrae]
MDSEDFRLWSHKVADWGADYRANLRDQPVRAQTQPGDIFRQLADAPPEQGESMETIFADFERIVPPGLTHWQHPRFFAYFPANAAPVSVIADYLVTAIAAQCMLWQTSPAATEMETRVVDWLRQALGLIPDFAGVIHDSASTATLAAVLTMRERALSWRGNTDGLAAHAAVRIYATAEVHTSIDRALWIAGIGASNLVRIPTQGSLKGMDPSALDAAIRTDRAAGLIPAGVIACVGGTSVGACDPIGAVADVAHAHGLTLHVDAAWAGSAMICHEFRGLWEGIDKADSIVFNPHKWLGAQFDCSVQFLKTPADQVRTLAIHPEYLKTHGHDGLINYSEWSVPLGRKFRALKLWFLLRHHGLDGLRTIIRNHVAWAQELAARLAAEPDFELVTQPVLSLFSFRHRADADVNAHNLTLLQAINDDGRIYLTQTRVNGAIALRFQAGSFDMTRADMETALEVIVTLARRITT